jgi:hypothetical protein
MEFESSFRGRDRDLLAKKLLVKAVRVFVKAVTVNVKSIRMLVDAKRVPV